MLSGEKVKGTDVEVDIAGGTHGEIYVLHAIADDEGSNRYESDVELLVLDHAGWTPDGNGGYLSPKDYVIRFGYDETTLLTDIYRIGRIDSDALGQALTDADAAINGYLQARYALPLSSTPAVLKQIAADIARHRLHRDRAPDTVTERYRAAIAQLKDIQIGKFGLGLDEDGAATPATSGEPAYSAPGRIFTRDTLEGY